MSRNWSQDVIGILRGAQSVVNATVKLQEAQCKQIWENSSVKNIIQEAGNSVNSSFRQTSQDSIQNEFSKKVMETLQRTSMVFEGVKGYAKFGGGYELAPQPPELEEFDINAFELIGEKYQQDSLSTRNLQASTDVKAPEHTEPFSERKKLSESKTDVKEKPSKIQSEKQEVFVAPAKIPHKEINNANISKSKSEVKLSATAKERKVPASRIARLVSFGSLAAGLGIGTVAEVTRRSLGLTKEEPSVGGTLDSAFLSEANAERIVNTLCKVRGAALKLGQILSIQDNTIISPTLQKAFERVRQSADFMPTWQVEKVLETELGEDWQSKIKTFDYKPFAAASIGQVHSAVLPDGTEVAMKIQYPGVAKGIENELTTKQIFTTELVEGIPVDKSVDMDLETREHIGKLLMELCLKELFEFQYMQTDPNWWFHQSEHSYVAMGKQNIDYSRNTSGATLEKANMSHTNSDSDTELTPPEISAKALELILLDFGASRPYSKKFLDTYIQIIRGAADDDRDAVLKGSREVFRKAEPFDFGAQNTTKRIQHLVPTMLKHRLCPPPEEIYSLHRKLSGIFLLVAKLNVKVECKSMFDKVYEYYRSR
ncbi:hypothetical protein C0J52_15929 [Blattella germanica]|nr:hypothetical protein C0J52_15929 [Blattella germanica]